MPPPRCIARINCASSEQCPEVAIQASQTSNGKAVYCQRHYMLLNSSQQVCNVDLGRRTMNDVARFVAASSSYSPRSSRYTGSPVSRAAMSPRSSTTTYPKMDSPRFQQDFQNDYEVGGSNEGFNAGSNLRKKNTIRPKSLFTRRNTAPNFTTEEGSVKLLFIIDETDDVNEAIVNLRKFKLIVFAADMNTTNKPDDFEERARVTEDIVDKTAEILSAYMNNPMRIELVLSFLYDYDTRDLDVDFGYFGFRNPKGDILLDTTLDEYIEQNYKNGKWFEYPTPDVHEDYERDTREQVRKEISEAIKTWTDKPGQSEFNKILKNLRTQLTNDKFIIKIARENYEEGKLLWNQITRNTQQQTQHGTQNRSAFAAAAQTGTAISSNPANTSNMVLPSAIGVAAQQAVQPTSNLSFDEIIDKIYGTLTDDEKLKLKKLDGTQKTQISNALNVLYRVKNKNTSYKPDIIEFLENLVATPPTTTVEALVEFIKSKASTTAVAGAVGGQQVRQDNKKNSQNRSQSNKRR